MNSIKLRSDEVGGMRELKAAELKRRKDSARRAYEGGAMTVGEICEMVRTDTRTFWGWKKEGQWERKP